LHQSHQHNTFGGQCLLPSHYTLENKLISYGISSPPFDKIQFEELCKFRISPCTCNKKKHFKGSKHGKKEQKRAT
jgi:hypothetical protein